MIPSAVFFIAIIFATDSTSAYFCGPSTQERILSSILSYNYASDIRPNSGISPTVIRASLRVSNVEWMDPSKNKWRSTVYLRLRWNDPRLRYVDNYYCDNFEYLSLTNPETTSELWKPVPMFYNKVEGFQSDGYVRLYPNGDVFHSLVLTQTLMCPKLDESSEAGEIICNMAIYAYGLTSSNVILKWIYDDPIALEDWVKTTIEGFDLKKVVPKTEFFTSEVGELSLLLAKFHFVPKSSSE